MLKARHASPLQKHTNMKKITLYLIATLTVLAVVLTACKKENDAAVTGITLNKDALNLSVGQEEVLEFTILPSNANNKKVSWTSNNPEVATVLFGVVSAKKEGTAIITVTTEDGGKTATCTVTVVATTIPVTGVTLNHSLYQLETGHNFTLTATVLPQNASNKAVTWSSSSESVARVNANGTVTAVSAGTAIITVTTEDGNKQAVCTLTVRPVPGRVTDCRHVPGGLIIYDPLPPDSIGVVSFLSSKTWIVGNQEWSDVVKASNCSNRTSFIGINQEGTASYINCRSNPGYGDLFSWCAVITGRNILCPDGWRLPTNEDFIALDKFFGGDGEVRPRYGGPAWDPSILGRYINEWGAVYSGNCNGTGQLGGQLDAVWYWQQTEGGANSGGYFGLQKAGEWTNGFISEGSVTPFGTTTTAMGMQVRCIRQAFKN
jgi:uncharacterized protein (TIGR02145 family)